MKKIIKAILVFFILLAVLSCNSESKKKEMYELQEHCGRSTEQWVKARPGEILNYRSHYNAHLNKCFVLATLSPDISNNFYSSFDILYDVNENKEYGHRTIRFDNKGAESDQCFIRGKYFGGSTEHQVKQKWDEFVKEIMEE
jgi:hypothetical protein